MHPALWKKENSVKGKRVALVGYGCRYILALQKRLRYVHLSFSVGSGVQIGPNIVADVEKLYTWFRNKTYILPPPNQPFAAEGGANFKCQMSVFHNTDCRRANIYCR